MKKFHLSILSICFGYAVNAQTLTEANHSPVSNTGFNTYQCDSLGINTGASGAGASWNFSAIATRSSIVNNYTTSVNTSTSYPMPGITIASSINNVSYYQSTPSDLKYWGGNILVGGVTANLVYSAGAITATYPMSLTTSGSATTSGSISIPALSQTGTFTGNSNTIADGSGTLTVPGGTYTNAIRVVTSQTINFTVQLGAGTVTQKNYDYYDTGTKAALFTISTSTVTAPLAGTSSQTIVTRSFPSTVGIKENKQTLTDLMVYPNPSSSTLNFSTESKEAKHVLIYDITGKLIEKQNLTDGKLKVNVLDYNSGLYIYSVIGTTNQVLKTGKITVGH